MLNTLNIASELHANAATIVGASVRMYWGEELPCEADCTRSVSREKFSASYPEPILFADYVESVHICNDALPLPLTLVSVDGVQRIVFNRKIQPWGISRLDLCSAWSEISIRKPVHPVIDGVRKSVTWEEVGKTLAVVSSAPIAEGFGPSKLGIREGYTIAIRVGSIEGIIIPSWRIHIGDMVIDLTTVQRWDEHLILKGVRRVE